MLAFVFVLALALAGSAVSQDQGGKKEPLNFVKNAADVALNVQQDSLNGYLGIYISPADWDGAVRDGDLGPFMKLKEAGPKDGRSAACFFSPNKDAAICVYFDGDAAFGVDAVKAASDGKIKPADVAASYKPIPKDMPKKSSRKLKFTEGGANTDEGYPLPAFAISMQ